MSQIVIFLSHFRGFSGRGGISYSLRGSRDFPRLRREMQTYLRWDWLTVICRGLLIFVVRQGYGYTCLAIGGVFRSGHQEHVCQPSGHSPPFLPALVPARLPDLFWNSRFGDLHQVARMILRPQNFQEIIFFFRIC